MSKIKLTTEEEVTVVEEVIEEVVEETPMSFSPEERIPCDWSITINSDNIHAVNRITQREFTGSMTDFNKAFK